MKETNKYYAKRAIAFNIQYTNKTPTFPPSNPDVMLKYTSFSTAQMFLNLLGENGE